MTKTLSFFNRLTTFLLGLLLVFVGLFPIAEYWDIPYLSDFIETVDRSHLADLPYEGWYVKALIAASIVLLIIGLWILLANISSRAFSNGNIVPADAAHGDTVINVQRVSEAACDTLQGLDEVLHADSRVATVINRPTATFTVTANPSYPLEDVIRIIEAADDDFRMASHTMDIDTVWKLQFDRVTA